MKLFEMIMYIVSGMTFSLQLMISGLFCGLILGLLFAILRHAGYGVFIIKMFVSVIRGTPLILQLSFFYFVFPSIMPIKPNIMIAGIIAFALNSSAYIAEIIRAGINSIPKGQFEAAQTLMIPSSLLWKDIILPQVYKNILPALVNESISLLKETALIATIGGMDIMRRAQIVSAEQFCYFTPLCIAAVCYYALVLFIETCGFYLERKSSSW